MTPRLKTDQRTRESARRIRDDHWRILERIAECDPLWICWWDKLGRHRRWDPQTGLRVRNPDLPDDLLVFGLIDAGEFVNWVRGRHQWIEVGDWSDDRYAAPVRLNDAGRAALANRAAFDMEPVEGGLVEPGWQAIPVEATA